MCMRMLGRGDGALQKSAKGASGSENNMTDNTAQPFGSTRVRRKRAVKRGSKGME